MMKKLLGILLWITLTLGITALTLAAELSTSFKVSGEIFAGYIKMPGYISNITDLPDYAAGNYGSDEYVYENGQFFSQFRSLNVRLLNDVTFCQGLYGQLVSQMEFYKDDSTSKVDDLYASAVQNVNLTYNPGFAMFQFDLKGQDINVGIKDEELLKINVARRYAKYAEPHIYRHFEGTAKQFTAQIPFDWGRAVAVVCLEPADHPADFAGGFVECLLGSHKVTLAYQPKMTDGDYEHKVWPYFVLATDFNFSPNCRLQVDYSNKNKGESGVKNYKGYFKPIDVIECYPGTTFYINQQINSRFTLNNYLLKLRLFETTDSDLKYWADISGYFKPFTFGINYRDWRFDKEEGQAKEDGYVGEFYIKHDLHSSWRDYLKVFYRTDKSYGAVMNFNFY